MATNTSKASTSQTKQASIAAPSQVKSIAAAQSITDAYSKKPVTNPFPEQTTTTTYSQQFATAQREQQEQKARESQRGRPTITQQIANAQIPDTQKNQSTKSTRTDIKQILPNASKTTIEAYQRARAQIAIDQLRQQEQKEYTDVTNIDAFKRLRGAEENIASKARIAFETEVPKRPTPTKEGVIFSKGQSSTGFQVVKPGSIGGQIVGQVYEQGVTTTSTVISGLTKAGLRGRSIITNPQQGLELAGKDVASVINAIGKETINDPIKLGTGIAAGIILGELGGKALKGISRSNKNKLTPTNEVSNNVQLPNYDLPKNKNGFVTIPSLSTKAPESINELFKSANLGGNKGEVALNPEELKLVDEARKRNVNDNRRSAFEGDEPKQAPIIKGQRPLTGQNVNVGALSEEELRLVNEARKRNAGKDNDLIKTPEQFITTYPRTERNRPIIKGQRPLTGQNVNVGALSEEELRLVNEARKRNAGKDNDLIKTPEQFITTYPRTERNRPSKKFDTPIDAVKKENKVSSSGSKKLKLVDTNTKNAIIDMSTKKGTQYIGFKPGEVPEIKTNKLLEKSEPIKQSGYNQVKTKGGQVQLEKIGEVTKQETTIPKRIKTKTLSYDKTLYDVPIPQEVSTSRLNPLAEVQLNKIKSGSKIVDLTLNKNKQVGGVIGLSSIKLLSKNKSIQNQLIANRTLTSSKLLNLTIQNTKQITKQKTKQSTKQETQQETKPISISRNIERGRSIQLTPPRFDKLKIDLPKPKERIKEKKLPLPFQKSIGNYSEPVKTKKRKGFNVFIRKRGKILKINLGALSKESALALGGKRVSESAAATFFVKESNQEINEKSNSRPFGFNSNRFNFKKIGGVIKAVEKNKFRINTGGEISEISRVGQMARRNKNNSFSFIPRKSIGRTKLSQIIFSNKKNKRGLLKL